MTRKQKNRLFWILVVSLNLIPLVAQGEPSKKKAGTGASTAPAKPTPGLSVKGKATVTVSGGITHKAGDDKKDDDGPRVSYSGKSRELTRKDLTGSASLIMDFDTRKDGNKKAVLMGRIFKNCEPLLQITFSERSECTKVSADITHFDSAVKGESVSGPSFALKDLGGFEACMSAHIKNKDECTEDSCSYLSSVKGGTASLANASSGPITMLFHDANANESHGSLCHDFPTAMRFRSDSDIRAALEADTRRQDEQRKALALVQVKNCIHTEAELRMAYQACSVLVAVGDYPTREECVATEKLDQKGIDVLFARAKKAPIDELERVTDRLISWARSHPSECRKAIAPIHTIIVRLANQKFKQTRKSEDDEELDPLAGYETAAEIIRNAKEEAPCLDEDGTLSFYAGNTITHEAEKCGEIYGLYSAKCQDHYNDMAATVNGNLADSCDTWEMNPSCKRATASLSSARAVPQMIMAANMKTAQAQAAICQMVMASSNGAGMPPQCMPQQAQGGYGNIGQNQYQLMAL